MQNINKGFRALKSALILPPLIASLLVLTFTSCESWFDIKPESELVAEDFWKSESDVESAMAACYRAMLEPDFMERLIVWSEVRSDNVLQGTNATTDISNILNANVEASNSYTSWGAFYTVINYCNTVLENAPLVRDVDPEFKEGELRSYIAEAKTLRALCYFYLVRTFDNVPYITEAYTDDTQEFEVPQTDGDAIIDSLLLDLESISENYAKSVYSTTSMTKGRITQKAMWTLMADMYLWRNNYDKCIEYCEKVLTTTTNPLELESSTDYNRLVFGTGNSAESIFELEFDSDTPDYVVNEMYGNSGGRYSYNQLSSLNFANYSLFIDRNSDLRYKDALYANSSATIIPIKKYVAYRNENSSGTVSAGDYVTNENTQNWIFYRLSDVYLMEAEALVERNQGDDLSEAISLVSKTYDRANPNKGTNSLSLSDYSSQSAMRDLVFDERQREFLFEGKRYYDILRRVRRLGNLESIVSTYLIRKYMSQDQATVETRLNDLNALYMPINENELNVNKLLVQNPFYETSSDIEQNN
ncbi:MAG: RagB/SusD family nutrient uptake outer membrane protein [Prevotella sp.]